LTPKHGNDAAQQQLLLTRAKAIDAYAGVEQAMCRILEVLLNTSTTKAGIIFYRVVNSRSRNTILSDLMKEEHGDRYKKYWNSIVKTVNRLDQTRNQIIHWHTDLGVHKGGLELILCQPINWFSDAPLSAIGVEEMEVFSKNCDFVSGSLSVFSMFLRGDSLRRPEPQATWHEIFQQEAVCPPPCTHPLYRIYKES
jgi:hypothetical protein